MNYRTTLLTAGLLGATGVAFGALGAHAMSGFLADRGMTSAWETGARYQLFHAVALIGVAAWLRTAQGPTQRRLSWAATCWSVGTVLFSGSLYILAVGGPRWVGPVTPLGGITLMVGWLCVVAAAMAKED